MFDMFSGCFIDQGVVVMMYVIDNGFVEVVIVDMYRRGIDYVVQGDNCYFSGIVIDIYYYGVGCFRNW